MIKHSAEGGLFDLYQSYTQGRRSISLSLYQASTQGRRSISLSLYQASTQGRRSISLYIYICIGGVYMQSNLGYR